MRAFIETDEGREEVDDLTVVSKGARRQKIEAVVDALRDTAHKFSRESDFGLGVQTGLEAAALTLRGAIDD